MDGWMDGWTDGWMDGWMDRWMDGWTDGWMDGWMNERMDGWTDRQMDGWTDGWMDGCMDEWMDGWMDGLDGCNDSQCLINFPSDRSRNVCHDVSRDACRWMQSAAAATSSTAFVDHPPATSSSSSSSSSSTTHSHSSLAGATLKTSSKTSFQSFQMPQIHSERLLLPLKDCLGGRSRIGRRSRWRSGNIDAQGEVCYPPQETLRWFTSSEFVRFQRHKTIDESRPGKTVQLEREPFPGRHFHPKMPRPQAPAFPDDGVWEFEKNIPVHSILCRMMWLNFPPLSMFDVALFFSRRLHLFTPGNCFNNNNFVFPIVFNSFRKETLFFY